MFLSVWHGALNYFYYRNVLINLASQVLLWHYAAIHEYPLFLGVDTGILLPQNVCIRGDLVDAAPGPWCPQVSRTFQSSVRPTHAKRAAIAPW
jgi:hypothetical protein